MRSSSLWNASWARKGGSDMRQFLSAALLAGVFCQPAPGQDAAIVRLKVQEIASDFTVGYAVKLVDVNGDGKLDIVVVDSRRVVWYENPSWKMRTIIQGGTAADN